MRGLGLWNTTARFLFVFWFSVHCFPVHWHTGSGSIVKGGRCLHCITGAVTVSTPYKNWFYCISVLPRGEQSQSQCHSVTVSTSYKTPQNWFYFSVATRWTSREGSEGEKTEAPGPVSKMENLFQLKKIYHMCTATKYPLKCILTQSFYFITVDIGWSGCPISFT